jgi:glycosyltransferase involved in cell wall biosynthesis
MMDVSVIIPAYNEAARIGPVIRAARQYADEVLVVDDGSADETGMVAEAAGARVVRQANAGYIAAVKRGFREAWGEIVVTMDADGEHRADDIPRLVAPIRDGVADLVLGARSHVARPSERFLNWLTNFRVRVHDSGTGFRALRRELAVRLQLEGRCICGVSVLEPVALGAHIVEVPIELVHVEKPRRIAWYHLAQLLYVLKWLAWTVNWFQQGCVKEEDRYERITNHRDCG